MENSDNYETSDQKGIGSEIEKKKISRKINSGGIAITFVLIVMIAVSAIQTAELINILNKINSGNLQQSGTNSSNVPDGPGLDGLPDMVGGC